MASRGALSMSACVRPVTEAERETTNERRKRLGRAQQSSGKNF